MPNQCQTYKTQHKTDDISAKILLRWDGWVLI